MIVLICCIFAFVYACGLYTRGDKVTSSFIFFIFLTDGFMLLHSDWISDYPINKYRDFALLYMFFVFGFNLLRRGSHFFKISNPIHRWFLFLIIYLTIIFFVTVLLRIESFSYSLAVYRNYLFFLSFFLFKDLSPLQIKSLIIKITFWTIITAIIYTTQPLHNLNILSGYAGEDGVQENGMARYRNIPELLYFVLMYATIKLRFSSIKSILLLSLCGIALVLSQHRGVMLGYVVTIVLYLFLTRQTGRALQLGLIGIIGFLFVGNLIVNRFQNKGYASTSDDFENVLTLNYRNAARNGYDDEGGTLSFRILLLVERFDYFKKHPQYMLTGVGMRHEDSPQTSREFNFILGSNKINRETGFWMPQQIDSGDLVWFVPFVKFGLLGLFFYIYITVLMIRFFYQNSNCEAIAMSTFLYYVLLIFISLKNDMLFAPIQITFLFLLMELIIRAGKHTPSNLDFKLI